MSCFGGSKVDHKVLINVRNVHCGETKESPSNTQINTDIGTDLFAKLDFAVQEGLIERHNGAYKW